MRPRFLAYACAALCLATRAGAQSSAAPSAAPSAVLHGRVVDSAGVGCAVPVVVQPGGGDTVVVGRGVSAADGVFDIALARLDARVTVVAGADSGRRARLELDSSVVRASGARPIVLRLGRPFALATVRVRAHFQRRPSVFGFFEGEPASRVDQAGPGTTEWLDPLSAGGIDAFLLASPDLMRGGDGATSALGAPSSSNQLQIGGVRVPEGLVSGQLNGTVAVSPWDVTIGGSAGATVNLFLAPASRYRTAYAVVRSGVSTVPDWRSADRRSGSGVSVPAQVSASASGPLGRFGYRANLFVSDETQRAADWPRTLAVGQRRTLDSLASVLGTSTVADAARSRQLGAITRVDFIPFDAKRVLAITAGATEGRRRAGSGAGFATASASADVVDDVALLQLESTRVLGERVLSASNVSASLTSGRTDRRAQAPTVLVTDASTGGVLLVGGSSPRPASREAAIEARTTATWYSTNNRIRFVSQLDARLERASLAEVGPHATFSAASLDALARGTANALVRSNGYGAASARSAVLAPSASARVDLGGEASLLLGVRADAWAVSGLTGGASDVRRLVDVSPRVALLQRLGARSAHRGPIATLRLGAGRFTDWPNVATWSDAWRGADGSLQSCVGGDVPSPSLLLEAQSCGGGDTRTIPRSAASSGLRPAASDRADLSLAFSEVVPGVRGEIGAAVARNTRVTDRLSAFAGADVVDRLAGEDGRAVLVPVAAIDAAGSVPLASLPADQSYASRLESGASSTAVQWRMRLATRDPFARTKLSLAYALTVGHEAVTSLAPTDRPPALVVVPLSAAGRHSLAFSVSEWLGDVELRFAGLARSGVRFTGLADRDLNGDGRANDPAFVPAGLADEWARAVSPSARQCVRAAAGHLMRANGCVGPWSVSSLAVASIPGVRLGLRRGSSVEVQVSNPLAVAFGADARRRVVFGDVAPVSQVVTHVTGFDSAGRRFLSQPLGGFGASPAAATSGAEAARFVLSVRLPLGPSVASQRADAAMNVVERDSSARSRQRAATTLLGDIPPIPLVILQSSDGIQLTADERQVLQGLGRRWQAAQLRAASDALASNAVEGAAKLRLAGARARFLAEAGAISAETRAALTPDQIDLLPDGAQRLLNPRFLRYLSLQDAATF